MSNPLHPIPRLPHQLVEGPDELTVTRPVAPGVTSVERIRAIDAGTEPVVRLDWRRRMDTARPALSDEPTARELIDHPPLETDGRWLQAVGSVLLNRTQAEAFAAALLHASGTDRRRVIDLGGDLPDVAHRWEDGQAVWVVKGVPGEDPLRLPAEDLDSVQTMAAMRRRLAALEAADDASRRHSTEALAAAEDALAKIVADERSAGVADGEAAFRAQRLLDALAPLLSKAQA